MPVSALELELEDVIIGVAEDTWRRSTPFPFFPFLTLWVLTIDKSLDVSPQIKAPLDDFLREGMA